MAKVRVSCVIGKLVFLFAAPVLMSLADAGWSAVPGADGDWDLVWADEFDGAYLDSDKWTPRGGVRREGWWSPAMVSLTGDGLLRISTEKRGDRWLSGAIDSRGKFEHLYGYWEIRAKLQRLAGHWGAFWLLSPGFGRTLDARASGAEIDILEYSAAWGDKIHLAVHAGDYKDNLRSTKKRATVPGVSEGFHTFGLRWDSSQYQFYVDGRLVWEVHADVSQVPQYVLLTSEVGPFGGMRPEGFVADHWLIDYVRVYRQRAK
jgi:beta-glucanase (GH16 family)